MLKRFEKISLWLKSGIIAIFACLILTGFYLLVFRMLFYYFDPIPTWLIYPPIVTGHAFLPLVMYHFDASGPLISNLMGVVYILVLSLVYFIIGAVIGLFIQKRRLSSIS